MVTSNPLQKLIVVHWVIPVTICMSPASQSSQTIASAVQAWTAIDPNPTTRAYLKSHCTSRSSSSSELLQQLFLPDRRISFGTAGLRAAMQPGPLAMNDVTVLQAAQGIAATVAKTSPVVVIGYDHREVSTPYFLSSRRFAIISTLVFELAGLRVILLDGFVPTPLVPFVMQQQDGRSIGIMVTASHNPKQDAGYKVYWDDACQIRSPVDAEISRQIESNLDPWVDTYESTLARLEDQHPNDPCLGLSDPEYTKEMIDCYHRALLTSGLKTVHVQEDEVGPRICYSAMHGVGYSFVKRAFQDCGLPRFVSVEEQQEPDPDFFTVKSPNPEEVGALNLAQQTAEIQSCDIVLANDPDADRLAVMERNGEAWTTFTGDQIGALLGHWMWTQHKDDDSFVPCMCASTVSSNFLRAMALKEGFHFEETLAGFKWIGAAAQQLHGKPVPGCQEKSYKSIFSYEESIGYCCGNVVFDKDGISAAIVLAQLAIHVYREGRTLNSHLQSLYDTYGEFVSRNGYFALASTESVASELFEGLHGIKRVGSYDIASSRFLGMPGAYDTAQPDGIPNLPCGTPLLTLRFTNGCIAQFRASGTEPKFKYYFEMQGKPGVSRIMLATELGHMQEKVLKELFCGYFDGPRHERAAKL